VSDETPEERAERAQRWINSDHSTPDEMALASDVVALAAEVDRLRHGEKVRDGMLRRIIHREHRQVGWVVSGDEWWSLEPADGTFVEVREPLTPDEIAVLAALDTEEGGEQ
jgi:hypothetical protein